ncbi:hypothetical protein [Cohnella hashimotonis]|uniref:Uncharacterized protein n=1 Tax=Cohnella hashimotonis TaxID=2826895 RepID=A0ABT6TS43_9BACL|nr:hypothetical protein [Cohnella hashimotonis]MDI4649671.1 hypothetical protein [Cohnella hashimotonis]
MRDADWTRLKVEGVARIEKLVAEYVITQLDVPTGRFRVRIYESANHWFMGITNLRIKNTTDGCPEAGVGNGQSITEALEDTLRNFMQLLLEDRVITDDDFVFVDYNEF